MSFVHSGGCLYASDQTSDLIAEAFPGAFRLRSSGKTGKIAANVLTSRHLARHLPAETARWSTITQICEATSQIQRMVMARQLLK